jgi:hypothetical protein
VLATSVGHLLEVRGDLTDANGFVQRVAHEDTDVRTRESIGVLREEVEIFLRQIVDGASDILFEHDIACFLLGQRNVHTLLEATTDRGIQTPGSVRRTENKDALVVLANACMKAQDTTTATHDFQ